MSTSPAHIAPAARLAVDSSEALAWRRNARALADWAMARLVNRTDVWGGYLPLKYRTPEGSKSVTKPPVLMRGQWHLTRMIMVGHFCGFDHGNVVGTHTTSAENTSLWGLADVDSHGIGVDPFANEYAVLRWYQRLVERGFHPLLTTSDDVGGFHLRILFSSAVPTPRLYSFMRGIVKDREQLKVVSLDVFPKQPRLVEGGLGNWARVPGLHHTRPIWARVWNGDRWVSGDDAVQFILSCTGDSPDLIPPEVLPPPPKRPAGVVIINLPESQSKTASTGARVRLTDVDVALACLKAIDNSAGGGRHYDEWIAVGMVLHDLDSSAAMLDEWIAWSRKSEKHRDGTCEAKWGTFGGRGGWTLGSLVKWARDGGIEVFATSVKGGSRS